MTHPRTGTDEHGHLWQLRWGVLDPVEAMADHFGTDLDALTSLRETRTFAAPLWGETKTLHLYMDEASQTRYAVAEITPGVYAIGRDR